MGCLLFLTGCGARGGEHLAAWEEDKAGYVALTFDDGPSQYTEELLDGLKARNVHATFFLIGCQVEDYASLVRRMAAEGHQIGNHSYDHGNLQTMQPGEALADIRQCRQVLCRVLGEDTYWVRPPYGLISPEEMAQIPAPLVCWSVDSRDWELKDTGKVLQNILDATGDGDIVLLHDRYPSSVEAALQAVDRLREQGMEFVTVEELLRLRQVEPVCGKLYRQAKEKSAASD